MIFFMPVISYLLGSVSFSFLVAKGLKGIDIRKHGSGNAGATNTLRVLGVGPAVAVLILDVLKGVVAVGLGKWAAPDDTFLSIICGLSAIIGHNWPVFFGFRGGKGIATTVGVMLTLAFLPTLLAIVLFVLTIAVTRIVSAGSLILTASLPVILFVMERPKDLILTSIILFLFALVRHRSNIAKILKGTENKIGIKQ